MEKACSCLRLLTRPEGIVSVLECSWQGVPLVDFPVGPGWDSELAGTGAYTQPTSLMPLLRENVAPRSFSVLTKASALLDSYLRRTGLGVEKFYFVFKCPIEGSIELQIVEVDSKSFLDKILYRRKINVIKTFETTMTTIIKLEKVSTEFLQEVPVKENWFFLSNKIDNKNDVQGYFETWNYDSETLQLTLLKELKSFDLIQCLNSCYQLNECKIINFENEKCIIFSQCSEFYYAFNIKF
ncbi:hypothetical protein BpHYR1_047528 [Brachionus plicatilis]|uniref:Uncharacterized protein n=1 Tax=Brachionus plicatilis TaxID=10195 RepID=A0A3M7T6D3_BRAPC|nr:hypothetical protein BpHYR1_047528 [Brachionus plicatilis]